jgi:dihydrolipoamide dehydrogenase
MTGKTEADCEGMDIVCLKSFYRSNGKAVAMGETDGMCKLIVERESGKILGCHIFGAHSADMVQEVSALIACGTGIDELRSAIHSHPTLGEIIQAAANA